MARGGGWFGTLILIVLVGLGVYLLYEYMKSQSQSSGKGKSGGGVSGGGGSSSPNQQGLTGIGAALFNNFVNLAKYWASGQTLANLTLNTSSPISNSLIPTQSLQSFNLPSFPINFGGLGSLGGMPSLSTTSMDTGALIPTQPLQSFNLNSLAQPINFGS